MVHIQTRDFSIQNLTEQLHRQCAGQAGAIVAFTGYVRDYAPNNPTETLFLEHYPGMCEREIETLCSQARERWNILDTLVVHRVGALRNTEQIVFVGVASAHRGEAFRACEFIIDALKTRAPFWKREQLADGKSFWVEQRVADEEKTRAWNTPTDRT
jgi:molybdopterin synthase catalytic subunit